MDFFPPWLFVQTEILLFSRGSLTVDVHALHLSFPFLGVPKRCCFLELLKGGVLLQRVGHPEKGARACFLWLLAFPHQAAQVFLQYILKI